MDIRDRLETIKTSNENSYDEFDFTPYPPAKPAPPPIGRAWLSIWIRPRKTIRAIIDNDPGYCVWPLIFLVGLSKELIRASTQDLGDHVAFPILVLLCAIVGPMATWVGFSLGAAILAPIGRRLGGRATRAEIRAALAWGSAPYCVVLVLWLPSLVLIGKPLFTADKSALLNDPIARLAVYLMYLADLILLVWGLVLTLNTLVEVFRTSAWRVMLALVLMVVPFVAILIGPTILILIAVQTLTAPPPPTPFQAVPPMSLYVPRISAPPRPADGPVVRAIWDAGYGVTARTSSPQGGTVVGLELKNDVRAGVHDGALRLLRDLPDLRELTISPGTGLTDAGLESLRSLKRLRRLEIAFAPITDEGLASLSGLWRLRELSLIGCDRIRGPGLSSLESCPFLTKLSLTGSQVHGADLSHLGDLTWLTQLSLGDTGTTDDDLVHLAGLTRLEKLDLGAMNPIQGHGLVHLKSLPKLRELDLTNDPIIDDAIDRLKDLKALRKLDLTGAAISPSGMVRLRKALPNVVIHPAVAPAMPTQENQ